MREFSKAEGRKCIAAVLEAGGELWAQTVVFKWRLSCHNKSLPKWRVFLEALGGIAGSEMQRETRFICGVEWEIKAN